MMKKPLPEVCHCERGKELKAMLNGYYIKRPGAWE
jgi:hypothetical protein